MRKYTTHIVVLISMCLIFVGQINAEANRPIYIGDLIEIQIQDTEMTPSEINDLFQPFEIVSIDEANDGYIVVLRHFEPGRWEFDVKGQPVIIKIEALIDNENMGTDTIVEGEYELIKPGVYIPFPMIIIILSIVFITSLAYILIVRMKKKSKKTITAADNFNLQVNSIRLSDHELVFKLQHSLNDYFGRCMIKSSDVFIESEGSNDDILKQFSQEYPIPDELLIELKEWYKQGEFYKYSGITMPMEKRQDYLEQLKVIFQTINEFMEVRV